MKKIILTLLSFVYLTYSCTGVYLNSDDVTLFSANEDYWNYDTYYQTYTNHGSGYSILALGHSAGAQVIVNEKGLCYDGYSAPFEEVTYNIGKPTQGSAIIGTALYQCEKVEEVVALFDQYYLPWLKDCQLFFGDRFGNSVIIEGNDITYTEKDYQICTNFYQSNYNLNTISGDNPCWRYPILRDHLNQTDIYNIDLAEELLDMVHVENWILPQGPVSSVFSIVVDLDNMKLNIYNLYDYDNPITLDIEEEVNKSSYYTTLEDLFNSNIEENLLDSRDFNLSQNYPNPFNPTTSISYDVKRGGYLSMNIYNLNGEVVDEVFSRYHKVGNYSVEYSGAHLSSGIYYYSLSGGGELVRKRMVLIK